MPTTKRTHPSARPRPRARRAEEEAAATQYRTWGWLGTYVEPVLIVLVALPFGLLTVDEPPDDARLVAALVLVVLVSLVPCVVDVVLQHRDAAPFARIVRRSGGKVPSLPSRLAWRVTGWTFAQGLVAGVAAALLRALGGEAWSAVGMVPIVFALPTLGLTALALIGFLAWLGVRLVAMAVWRRGDAAVGEVAGPAAVPSRVAAMSAGLALLGTVGLVPAAGAFPGSPRRGAATVVAYAGWAFSGDGPAALMWLARVSLVLVVAGLVGAAVGTVWVVIAVSRTERERGPA